MFDKLISVLGGNLFSGVAEVVGKFVTDPTKLAEIQADLAKLEATVRTKALEIEASDRTSARQREMAVRDWTPAILAYSITAGFFGVLLYMLTSPIPDSGHDALLIMLGALGGAWASVVAYYFGSSAGSDRKTELLGKK